MSNKLINKIICGDCLEVMKHFPDNSIDLVVTSPPYFNERSYSSWNTFSDYFFDMENIFISIFNKIKNNRYLVLNVGNVTSYTEDVTWNRKRVPLGARFISLLERVKFDFIDDIIWYKGEPQSKRHIGTLPYPYSNRPINCYEHIIIAQKNIYDGEKVKCPVCDKMTVASSSPKLSNTKIWECKNLECSSMSKNNRGKRFSKRSLMIDSAKSKENKIPDEVMKFWRTDLIKLMPVLKINSKGENILGHSAPFPIDIPEMAIRFFSLQQDVVLDPFMGSGTTALAAIKLNRNYIGIDISQEYCDLAQERIDSLN